jgi:hypothetical protein
LKSSNVVIVVGTMGPRAAGPMNAAVLVPTPAMTPGPVISSM